MAAAVRCNHARNILDLIPSVHRAPAVVYILKPDGMKALIEPVQLLPDVAARH
jgi:hypothetical protein